MMRTGVERRTLTAIEDAVMDVDHAMRMLKLASDFAGQAEHDGNTTVAIIEAASLFSARAAANLEALEHWANGRKAVFPER